MEGGIVGVEPVGMLLHDPGCSSYVLLAVSFDLAYYIGKFSDSGGVLSFLIPSSESEEVGLWLIVYRVA